MVFRIDFSYKCWASINYIKGVIRSELHISFIKTEVML